MATTKVSGKMEYPGRWWWCSINNGTEREAVTSPGKQNVADI